MQENLETGALENVDFDNLLPLLPELASFKLNIECVKFDPPVDSCDIDPQAWKKIVRIIADKYDSADGFVILHGTDTMAYTASALSFMLEGLGKPVVLTGSQLPLGKLRTDGRENLITAIEIASAKREDGSAAVPEVCIFFHDKLLRGNRATKSDAERFDAFHSYNYPALAKSAVEINFNYDVILKAPKGGELKPHFEMDSHLLVMSLFPGISEDIFRSMLGTPGLKGVVLRTFGSGNAPSYPWLSSVLSEAVEKDIVIVNVTQCTGGNVAMERYKTGLQLRKTGLVSGKDSTVEAALAKMMRLFGDGLDAKTVRDMMNESICGEI